MPRPLTSSSSSLSARAASFLTARPTRVLFAVSTSALVALAMPLGASAQTARPDTQTARPDVYIDDSRVFPESVTSSADGTIYAGSIKGNVYRALPGAATAEAWIRADAANGILTILGVLADDASGTLWLCSTPNFFGPERSQGVASLMAFDLKTGAQKGVYAFPPPASVCNDITIGPDGSAYASDTTNGRILRLPKDGMELELYGQDASLVGIDGLAFSGDGILYVNNVRTNEILRVETRPNGKMMGLTKLSIAEKLGGPDGFRLIEGNRFLQAEGTFGRVGIVTIEGDNARLEVLSDRFVSAPGATPVGDTAYVLESNIRYLTDPGLKDKDAGKFVIYAVPMHRP